jgi:predicted transcriptional regulator
MGRGDLLDDLRDRGQQIWQRFQEGLREARDVLGEAAEVQGPRVSRAVKRSGRSIADAIGEGGGRLGKDIDDWSERLPSLRLGRREERSMFDKLFNRFTLGFGAGYVLGAKAGRQRYEQIVSLWEKVAGSSLVRQAAEQGRHLIGEAGEKITGQIQQRRRPERVSEVMTPLPTTVRSSQTVAETANHMRQMDVGSMIVVDDSGGVVGIVTDRDIAIRAVAQGSDPQTTTVGEISTEHVSTVSASDSIADAVRLMREKAVRRLPVVDGDRPVGIVSIGDLALDRDPRSALADISSEPPNR